MRSGAALRKAPASARLVHLMARDVESADLLINIFLDEQASVGAARAQLQLRATDIGPQ